MEANATRLGSLEDVINELLSANIFRFVLGNLNVLKELLKNPSILKSIMENESVASKLYGVELPTRIHGKASRGLGKNLHRRAEGDLRKVPRLFG